MSPAQLTILHHKVERALKPLQPKRKEYTRPDGTKVLGEPTLRHKKIERYSSDHGAVITEWVIENPSIPYNSLPRVTPNQYVWLQHHHPKMGQWVRYDSRPNEWIRYSDVPNVRTPSRYPMVRELWIGARSLDCINNPQASYEEDTAEESDIAMMVYDNMIEDSETGELRPIKAGDILTYAVKETRDYNSLDILYNDEPNDPREDGYDDYRSLTRDRIDRASGLERAKNEEGTRWIWDANSKEFIPINYLLHLHDLRVSAMERHAESRLKKDGLARPQPMNWKRIKKDPRKNEKHKPCI